MDRTEAERTLTDWRTEQAAILAARLALRDTLIRDAARAGVTQRRIAEVLKMSLRDVNRAVQGE